MAFFIQEALQKAKKSADAPGGRVVMVNGKPAGHLRADTSHGIKVRLVGQPGTGDPGTGFVTQEDAEAHVATWDTHRRKRVIGFIDQ